MVTILIGNESRSFRESSESWINQTINQLMAQGRIVCVRVKIEEKDIQLSLKTPTCQTGSLGGGRPPNQVEQQIIELWIKHGLTKPLFTGGDLIAFLKQLEHILNIH